MSPRSIYRSSNGERVIEQLYERAVDRLAIDVENRWVDTRHGRTHLLTAGDESAPPLVVFHGGNATNPMTLTWFEALAEQFRLFAPDTIGQPGFSAPTRVDPTGDGFGEWVVDLLDDLGLGSVPMVGPSYGAGIVLRTAAYAPERISAAALVVPVGFGMGSLPRLALRIGLPSMLYRYLPHRRLLDRVLDALATEPPDELDPIIVETVAASFRHVELERTFPGATADELAAFEAPTYVVAASDDPLYPAQTVLPAASEMLPNVVRTETLHGERHLLSPDGTKQVRTGIRELLNSG